MFTIISPIRLFLLSAMITFVVGPLAIYFQITAGQEAGTINSWHIHTRSGVNIPIDSWVVWLIVGAFSLVAYSIPGLLLLVALRNASPTLRSLSIIVFLILFLAVGWRFVRQ